MSKLEDQTQPELEKNRKGKTMALAIQSVNGVMLPTTFRETIEYAQVMSQGGVAVPVFMRNNAGACLSIIQTAMAWGMNPWLVARKCYSVNNIIAFEAQLIAAVLKARAPVKEKVWAAVYAGEGAARTCTITVHHAETGEEITVTSPPIGPRLEKGVKEPGKDYVGIWPKNSPLWLYDPDQQLYYYTIRLLGRRHFADILNGVYDVEEAYAMMAKDITPRAQSTGNFLNDDEQAPALEHQPEEGMQGQTIEVKAVNVRDGASAALNGHPVEAGKSYILNKETGEIKDAPLDPVANIIASINACADKKAMTALDADLPGMVATLSPEDQKRIQKARSDRWFDLDNPE